MDFAESFVVNNFHPDERDAHASGGVAMIGLGLDNGNLTNDAPFQFPSTFLPAGGSSGNLPEPTTLGLLGVAALAQWFRSR